MQDWNISTQHAEATEGRILVSKYCWRYPEDFLSSSFRAFQTVYISPDMKKDQRVVCKNLVTELKTKRNNHLELKFFIKSDKIVSESREV